MTNRHLKVLIAMVSVCITGIALMGAVSADEGEIEAVKGLLQKRTIIMENVLFGKISYDEGKRQLKEIEQDKLYNDDLESLTEYKNTDIERIDDMDIIKLEKKSQMYDLMTFDAEITWNIRGLGGLERETYRYQIGVERSDNEYKLVSMKH